MRVCVCLFYVYRQPGGFSENARGIKFTNQHSDRYGFTGKSNIHPLTTEKQDTVHQIQDHVTWINMNKCFLNLAIKTIMHSHSVKHLDYSHLF